jgi:hypothetical protein
MNDTTTAAITITTTATCNTRGRPRGKRRGRTTSDCSSRGDRRGRGGRGGGRGGGWPSRQASGLAVGVGRPLQAPQHVRDVARLDAVHYLAGVGAEYITTTAATATAAGASTCSSSLPGSLTARLGRGVAQKPTRTVRKDSQVKD